VKDRRTKPLTRVATIVLGAVAVVTQPARADFSFLTGVDYTSGKYGTTEETRVLYVPFTFKYEAQRYVLRLTVPYVSVDAPVGGEIIGIGADGQPIRAGGTGMRERTSGLGDVVAAAGYTVWNTGAGTLIDLVGKVKFGTADDAKGLGTGKNDYSLQLDGSSTVLNRFALIYTAGYRVYGDPEGIDFHNAFFGSLGGVYKFSAQTSTGLIYDTRQHILPGTEPQRELTVFVTNKIGKSYKVQSYVLGGFSDASPSWGVGLMLDYLF